MQCCLETLGQHSQSFYLFNVGPELTDNKDNNICNVVLNMLRQHCIRVLCLTQHCTKNYFSNVGQGCTDQTCFCWKISHKMLSWSAWANIGQGNYLCNIGQRPTINFAQKKNLQFCLDLSGPIVHKEITSCAMLTQNTEIYFPRKICFLKYLWWPVF